MRHREVYMTENLIYADEPNFAQKQPPHNKQSLGTDMVVDTGDNLKKAQKKFFKSRK